MSNRQNSLINSSVKGRETRRSKRAGEIKRRFGFVENEKAKACKSESQLFSFYTGTTNSICTVFSPIEFAMPLRSVS